VTTAELPLVIVNPASRGGAGARDWPRAAAALRSHFGPFARRFTEGPGHASELAREEAGKGRRLLLTFGGDGTISETARGILASGADCELGVLPHGTGGDFIRSLGMPSRMADAARALRRGRGQAIDVGRVTFGDGSARAFVNAASFGLSAEVAYRVNRARKTAASYAEQTVRAALDFEFPRVHVETDGKAPRGIAITSVSLHNGRFFGGGMKMAPAATLRDGRLQVIVVRKLAPVALLSRAPLLYGGAHLGLDDVEHGDVSRFSARPAQAGAGIKVEADGESVGLLPARFEVQPKALCVRLPRG